MHFISAHFGGHVLKYSHRFPNFLERPPPCQGCSMFISQSSITFCGKDRQTKGWFHLMFLHRWSTKGSYKTAVLISLFPPIYKFLLFWVAEYFRRGLFFEIDLSTYLVPTGIFRRTLTLVLLRNRFQKIHHHRPRTIFSSHVNENGSVSDFDLKFSHKLTSFPN